MLWRAKGGTFPVSACGHCLTPGRSVVGNLSPLLRTRPDGLQE